MEVVTGGPALTVKQRRMYRAILAFWAEHGKGPSVRDLMPVIPTTSPNGVVCHLQALVRRRAIVWDRDATSRGISVPALDLAVKEAARGLLSLTTVDGV